MKPINSKSGMAIVLVMTLTMGLLILGSSYLKSISQRSNHNTIELGSIQADLLAEGITQIAMLKLKELPGPLYYAALCKAKGNGNEPLDTYSGDAVLNGAIKNEFSAKYSTTFTMLPSKLYEDMNAKITVVLNLSLPDGRDYERQIERTVSGARKLSGK
ncbi:MAG: hypothetical protein PHQ02_04640 [Candidatus Riflebacteria bacterium]|nr:hypothetical protein [Candidatus Riflebacteria bacterium]